MLRNRTVTKLILPRNVLPPCLYTHYLSPYLSLSPHPIRCTPLFLDTHPFSSNLTLSTPITHPTSGPTYAQNMGIVFSGVRNSRAPGDQPTQPTVSKYSQMCHLSPCCCDHPWLQVMVCLRTWSCFVRADTEISRFYSIRL